MYVTSFMIFCLIFTSLFFCSYLSTLLKNQFDHTAEAILPSLINLILNSAKVINLFYLFLAHSLLSFGTKDTCFKLTPRVDPCRVDLNLCRANKEVKDPVYVTSNGKREFLPRDQVSSLLVVY